MTFLGKKKEKQVEKAKQKTESELTGYMSNEEKEKFESYAKKAKWARRGAFALFGLTFAVALLHGDQTIGMEWFRPLASFGENISNFMTSITEYVFMNTQLAAARIASIAIPFVCGYKLESKTDFYNFLKNNIEEKAMLRKNGVKKGYVDSLKNRAKSLKELTAKNELEKSNIKLTEEEINEVEKHIHLNQWKKSKRMKYIFAGTTLALMAIMGHQFVDGVFYDTALSLGENITNFFSTGSIYQSALSLKDNLDYMFYSAVENFELHKPISLGMVFATIFSGGLHSIYKGGQEAGQYKLEELNGEPHRKGLVKSFFDKMLERKNEGKDIEPAIPTIIPYEKTK